MGLIRFILALSVLIFHSSSIFGLNMMDGIVAVKGFFVISGFYMALILNEKYIAVKNSYRLFITNRILRIYPVYWIVLLLTLISGYFWAYNGAVNQTIVPQNFHAHGVFLYDTPLGILRDFTLLFRLDYINPYKLKVPRVAPAWTLVLEFMFYLLAPFLVKLKWKFLLLLLILSFTIRYLIYFFHMLPDEYHITGFFPATLGYFLIGIFSYRMYVFLKIKSIPIKYQLFSFLIIFLYIFFWDKIPTISLYGLLLKDVLFYPLLFLSIPFIFNLSKFNIFDKFLADLSYPMYISHWFIFNFIKNIFMLKNFSQTVTLIAIVVTLISAVMFKVLIDDPINSFRQKRLK